MNSNLDRALGCLVGLAVGDAVGTTLEFRPRGSFKPLTDMSEVVISVCRKATGPMIRPWRFALRTVCWRVADLTLRIR